jgi:hypothetical protein
VIRTSTHSATPFEGESLALIPLLAVVTTALHSRARARLSEYRVLLFALGHAGFYPRELYDTYNLPEGGARSEIRRTLKEFVRLGLLHSLPRQHNARTYHITSQGRKEAAKLGADLISQANEALESMKQDAWPRLDSLIALSLA